MDDDVVIKVENLNKKFCRSLKRSMAYGFIDMTKNLLGRPTNQSKLRKGEFWALEDISFELKKGETLGIIGENGSGKSTLLRVLTGIFPPDSGKITIRGNIGGLIAVGAGFHPHLTGRENIYLNGTILGMTYKEIDDKFQSIVDFADIGDFLEAPVSTYSSGMKVRLGFAIAIHVDPDILLIDEVLSVGDLSFRNKSLRFMSNLNKKAKAIVFISHNLEQIRNLCQRTIVLDNGKIIFDGETNKAINIYESLSRDTTLINMDKTKNPDLNVQGIIDTETVILTDTGITNLKGEKVKKIEVDEPFIHYFEFELLQPQEELIFTSSISDDKGCQVIWNVSNDLDKYKFTNIKPGKYRLAFKYNKHHLLPGVYTTSHGIRNSKTYETFQKITSGYNFIVTSDKHPKRAIINTDYNIELLKI